MEVNHTEIKKIIPYARNPRINDQAISKVAASLKEFGWQQPIVVDNENVIIVGHTRLLAAQQLGMDKVPVLVAKNLSDAQVKAYRITDNKSGEHAEWDFNLLSGELSDLLDFDFDIDITGFDDSFILQDEVVGLTDEDAVPDVPEEATTVLGDIWILGNHRLMCGDSTSIDAVEKLMDGQKADMVFTDPPYGINEKGDRRNRNGKNSLRKGVRYDDFVDDSVQYAIDAYQLCEGMGIPRQVWWGANYYCHSLPQSNNWFIWDKRVEEKQHDLNSDCEMAWVRSEYSSIRIFRHLWKGLMKDSERGTARVHPTQKPVALAIWAFDYFKNVEIVLDLFGGSGSTLIACEKTNRNCRMMELDPKYCDVIINRWQDFTGKKAVHENGLLFDQVKENRL